MVQSLYTKEQDLTGHRKFRFYLYNNGAASGEGGALVAGQRHTLPDVASPVTSCVRASIRVILMIHAARRCLRVFYVDQLVGVYANQPALQTNICLERCFCK